MLENVSVNKETVVQIMGFVSMKEETFVGKREKADDQPLIWIGLQFCHLVKI